MAGAAGRGWRTGEEGSPTLSPEPQSARPLHRPTLPTGLCGPLSYAPTLQPRSRVRDGKFDVEARLGHDHVDLRFRARRHRLAVSCSYSCCVGPLAFVRVRGARRRRPRLSLARIHHAHADDSLDLVLGRVEHKGVVGRLRVRVRLGWRTLLGKPKAPDRRVVAHGLPVLLGERQPSRRQRRG